MFIKNIKVENFRNYENELIEFNKNINIIYGNNAQGKTNILEAIFFSALGKSFRTSKEKQVIMKEKDFFKIHTEFQKKDREGYIDLFLGDDKSISVNGVKLNKLSELLGNINIVIFSPEDINLLKDESAVRRKFLDMMISQLRKNYIYNLNNYKKNLEQKNNYLKSRNISDAMLDVYDEKLAEYSENVYQYRNEFIEKIKEKIKEIHSNITDEDISIVYKTDCESKEKCLEKLKKNREKDKYRGFSSVGCHRDDFKILINGDEVDIYGSQGQNRTAILSLKMAELEVINDEIGEYPILLLDDFMSELDQERITNFLKSIKNIQVIITCTEKIDLENSTNFYVNNGKILLK
jgi:DNA replication and repair protein RecF